MMIDHEFEDLPSEYRKEIPKVDYVLHAEPTSECPNGTHGRVAAVEVVEITDKLEQAILEGASENSLYKIARANGFISMKEDAIIKAMRHEIPLEEINTLGGSLIAGDPELEDELKQENTTGEEHGKDVDNTDVSTDGNTV